MASGEGELFFFKPVAPGVPTTQQGKATYQSTRAVQIGVNRFLLFCFVCF